MKRFVFTVFWTLTLMSFTGCSNESENVMQNSQEANLTLTAPNGEIIAKDIPSLRNETTIIIAKQFGDDFNFTITDIEYIPVGNGYLALVSYELEDGRRSNYAKTNSLEVINSSPVDIMNYKSSNKNLNWEINDEKTVLRTTTRGLCSTSETSFVCKSATNCKPCQVKVSQFQDSATDGQVTKIACNDKCADCKLEVTIK